MIFELQPANLGELLEAYRKPQPASLRDAADSVPEARLDQTLSCQGTRLAQVYGSSWERLAAYADRGEVTLFSEDYRSRQSLDGAELLSHFSDFRSNGRPRVPEQLALRVSSVEDAVLMADRQRIYREQRHPDVLNYLLEDPLRVNIFDRTATRMDTEKYPSVWSPSIDTDLFRLAAKVIIESEQLDHIRNAAEIGCANAAIARYLVDSVSTSHLLLADLNPIAITCARETMSGSYLSMTTQVGEGMAALDEHSRREPFDFVACNPPYLPRPARAEPGACFPFENSAHFEGTQLFEKLIRNAHQFLAPGGRLLLNVSSLAFDALAAADAVALDSGLERRLLFTKRVPVKVYEFLTDAQWQSHLRDSLVEKDGYLWQQLLLLEYHKP